MANKRGATGMASRALLGCDLCSFLRPFIHSGGIPWRAVLSKHRQRGGRRVLLTSPRHLGWLGGHRKRLSGMLKRFDTNKL